MKTTIDIPERALSDAMRFAGAKTKKEAVVAALADFNRRHRMAEATKVLGTSDTFITHEDLMNSRQRQRVS